MRNDWLSISALLALLLAAGGIHAQLGFLNKDEKVLDGTDMPAPIVQWGYRIQGYSSQDGYNAYSAKQALGEPDKWPACGDAGTAWAPGDRPPDEEGIYIRVAYKEPMLIRQVMVAETNRAGCVEAIYLIDRNRKEHEVFRQEALSPEAEDSLAQLPGRMLRVTFKETRYKVYAVKVVLRQREGWNRDQIDAIGISTGTDPWQPAIAVTDRFVYPGSAKPLETTVNSAYTEVLPRLSPDGERLYFCRKNHPANYGMHTNDDIWFAERQADGSWGPAESIGWPLNDENHNYVCSVGEDGLLTLGNGYTFDRKPKAGVSQSFQSGGDWVEPLNLVVEGLSILNLNAEYYLSRDRKTLILAMESWDSEGGKDLYVSFSDDALYYSRPVSMGFAINSGGQEMAPFLSDDGQHLFFSSDGFPGYGGQDVFVSERLDDSWTRWSPPENLGPTVNSPAWDAYFYYHAPTDQAYVASNRGNIANEDLYVIEMKPEREERREQQRLARQEADRNAHKADIGWSAEDVIAARRAQAVEQGDAWATAHADAQPGGANGGLYDDGADGTVYNDPGSEDGPSDEGPQLRGSDPQGSTPSAGTSGGLSGGAERLADARSRTADPAEGPRSDAPNRGAAEDGASGTGPGGEASGPEAFAEGDAARAAPTGAASNRMASDGRYGDAFAYPQNGASVVVADRHSDADLTDAHVDGRGNTAAYPDDLAYGGERSGSAASSNRPSGEGQRPAVSASDAERRAGSGNAGLNPESRSAESGRQARTSMDARRVPEQGASERRDASRLDADPAMRASDPANAEPLSPEALLAFETYSDLVPADFEDPRFAQSGKPSDLRGPGDNPWNGISETGTGAPAEQAGAFAWEAMPPRPLTQAEQEAALMALPLPELGWDPARLAAIDSLERADAAFAGNGDPSGNGDGSGQTQNTAEGMSTASGSPSNTGSGSGLILYGGVYNAVDGEAVPSQIAFYQPENGRVDMQTDSTRAFYTVGVRRGQAQEVVVHANGFFTERFRFTPRDPDGKGKVREDFELIPIREGQTISLENIYFDVNSSVLQSESFASLDRWADILSNHPGVVVQVQGHTNNLCSPRFCQQLSQKRARAVSEYLAERGVAPGSLRFRGFGSKTPVADNNSAKGRAKNQRVELKILKAE
jgi:outer membrane protein OmpA-like peptidoglycan-associated protein